MIGKPKSDGTCQSITPPIKVPIRVPTTKKPCKRLFRNGQDFGGVLSANILELVGIVADIVMLYKPLIEANKNIFFIGKRTKLNIVEM